MKNQTVLITGVTGFLGRYIAALFHAQGWAVIGTGTRSPENAPLHHVSTYKSFRLPSPEFSDLVGKLQPDLCVHCAGRASVELSLKDPEADYAASVHATQSLLEALRLRCPTCKVINLSSAAIYGNPIHLPVNENHRVQPLSPYGYHKRMCELLCEEYNAVFGLQTVNIRIFSAYGAGIQRQVVWDICQKALTQSSIQLRGTGHESRDFIHAKDVAQAILLIAQSSLFQAEIYNVASGSETTIANLADRILSLIKQKTPVEWSGQVAAGVPLRWQADIQQLQALGFAPRINLDDGLQSTITWARQILVSQ